MDDFEREEISKQPDGRVGGSWAPCGLKENIPLEAKKVLK